MFKNSRFSVSLVLCLFLLGGASVSLAQSPLKTIDHPSGGKIFYGVVDGATSSAAAMSAVLRIVHNNCGDKPQVGKVFRVRGTNSDAVFFTVVNRPQGNKHVAGLLIAAPSGPNQMEAALVSDNAARFGSTVNPMLNQLFGVWRPGGEAAHAAKPGAPGAANLPPMRQIALSDSTATLSLPAGWNVDPQSGGGSARVTGPQGEKVALNMYFMAQDPYSQSYQNQMRMGIKFQHNVIYPSRADLTKSFADIFQKLRAVNGLGPAPLKVDSVQPVTGSEGQCVEAIGQVNPDGNGMREMKMLLSRTSPDQYGSYFFIASQYQLPLGATEQQHAAATAIMAGYKADMQLVQARAAAQSAPMIAQMQRTYQAHQAALRSMQQQAIDNIHQIGANATARYNAAQAANEAQHAGYWANQDNNARQNQGFHNYLLDQTVIQDNNMYGNGTIGHGTVWNSTADALVKANPNRYEIVNTPNFWSGWDY